MHVCFLEEGTGREPVGGERRGLDYIYIFVKILKGGRGRREPVGGEDGDLIAIHIQVSLTDEGVGQEPVGGKTGT